MWFKHWSVLILLIISYKAGVLQAQGTITDKYIISQPARYNDKTISTILSNIENEHEIVFTYAGGTEFERKITGLKNNTISLTELLKSIFSPAGVEILSSGSNRIILKIIEKPIRTHIYGYIREEGTGELVSAALVIDKESGVSELSNDKGYYYLRLSPESKELEVRCLGYDNSIFNIIKLKDGQNDLFIRFNNEIAPLIISSNPLDATLFDPVSINISEKKWRNSVSVLGDHDYLKSLAGMGGIVVSGEGQNGIILRGGGYDQTAILLEGMPLYEANHIVGLSSIFISEGVRSIDVFKNGQPARFNGRLAGAVNVHLKDGNTFETSSSLSAGIFGLKFHLEGPIYQAKTSYSLAVRHSWIDYLIRPFITRYTDYNAVDLRYRDVQFKLTHRFSPSQQLSASVYYGGDRVFLGKTDVRNTTEGSLTTFESNGLKWGNTLVSLNYENIINARSKVFVQAGFLDYRYRSRSTYDFVTETENDRITEYLDLLSHSKINDLQLKASWDYYMSEKSKLKIGTTWINHQYLPALKQSYTDAIVEKNFINQDSIISGKEIFIFSEFNYNLNDKLHFYPGVNFAIYKTREGKAYQYLQPRMRLLYHANKKTLLSLSYSATSQFTHLLLNPGLGLPSDLWVPSTENIAPQTSNHYSIDGQYFLTEGISVNLSLFYRDMKNILEYRQPIDLFTGIVNGTELIPVFNQQNDWEAEVLSGIGTANGIEMSIKKETGKLKGIISYTYSRSILQFSALNNNIAFPSKYDIPHNLNIQFNYLFDKEFRLHVQWDYVSGRPFSLATEEFDTFFGIRLLRSSGRNNYRLPDFHQLSINVSKKMKISGVKSEISIGGYNLYNRYNAFYIYAYRNNLLDSPTLRKVSIFPFIPQLNLNFSW